MKQKSFYHHKINNKGYLLPYVLFLNLILLNIFILSITICLNEKKTFNDKDKYYHVFILEERAKRHVYEKLSGYSDTLAIDEVLNYEGDTIYLKYSFDQNNDVWTIILNVCYDNVYETAYIYYYINDDKIRFDYR
ncbi:MAG: hypothetical protein K0Q49_1776 [Haloplasmataceae bacterium]|jgi:hypothetical protein|nr:hypothetical protein [Haloplasmataceae bacterium]